MRLLSKLWVWLAYRRLRYKLAIIWGSYIAVGVLVWLIIPLLLPALQSTLLDIAWGLGLLAVVDISTFLWGTGTWNGIGKTDCMKHIVT